MNPGSALIHSAHRRPKLSAPLTPFTASRPGRASRWTETSALAAALPDLELGGPELGQLLFRELGRGLGVADLLLRSAARFPVEHGLHRRILQDFGRDWGWRWRARAAGPGLL